jgi:broad specificity phosphatase PhoE
MLRCTLAALIEIAMTEYTTTEIADLPTLYIARHAETVFNAGARMQGWMRHTPLTRAGFAQAVAMGDALRTVLGDKPDVALWASTAGRTQQTMALICDALGLDFFDVRTDDRLQEIHVGDWEGRSYAEVVASHGGPIADPEWGLFSVKPPGGEWYDDIAARMASWLGELRGTSRPCLVISHGISARVLRGLLVGGPRYDGIAMAPSAPQGTVFRVAGGKEEAIHIGSGAHRIRGV